MNDDINEKLKVSKNLNKEKGILTVSVEGKLDTNAAVFLEDQIKEDITSSLKTLIYDFSKLEYIASSGIRVLIASQKLMSSFGGDLSITHVSGDVRDVFEMTGLADALNIQFEKK